MCVQGNALDINLGYVLGYSQSQCFKLLHRPILQYIGCCDIDIDTGIIKTSEE